VANFGILGIGSHLPAEVRGNDWWPEAVVARWRQRQGGSFASPTGLVGDDGSALPEGARRIAEAIAADRDDPFQGVRERRIAPDGTYASDMEVAAARAALQRAAVDAAEIDFVL
jgi:3-oxoacyl-[acyl-carrier-protein] synthase-3